MSADRYDRQTRLEDFGPEGQRALSEAAVLIIGAGGLGVPAATYLNAMGIGRLGLVDGDVVETSNLHRQPAYGPASVGMAKVRELEKVLRAQNPDTQLDIRDTFLNPTNALELIGNYDLVVDATDNLPTRFLVDDACLMLGIPWVYGALHGFEGQVSVFNYRGGPTYRCLFPVPPPAGEIPDCDTLGTLGVLPGLIGTMQALEAVKAICGQEGVCAGKLLLYDARKQQTLHIAIQKDANRTVPDDLSATYQLSCEGKPDAVSGSEYLRLRKEGAAHLLVDVREPGEFESHHLDGARNIPMKRIASDAPDFSSGNPVYLICETGPRSRRACRELQSRWPSTPFFWISGGMRQLKVESQ
ncbi:HesA/MoeB/ThiF family protein [Robiginitalea biformata]|uniref:Molybdopterin biosynthesis protein MoeB n=1 Tax=Robiginitalea biformata (strain ATCC BAA-864 / DSM 15991 / KCTC 12146 / HTCC2501) TaxID=313596 RepID=A4CL84_ROBBH|nr:HesA/MoeB/ThiF family protein [Robiginitalea biformata]EAR15633.1 molybdopterin biosynthesis protein MoeB [Robiginitalea biformata HTCC2501]